MLFSLWSQLVYWLYDLHRLLPHDSARLRLVQRVKCWKCSSRKKRVLQAWQPEFESFSNHQRFSVRCEKCRNEYLVSVAVGVQEMSNLNLLLENYLRTCMEHQQIVVHTSVIGEA